MLFLIIIYFAGYLLVSEPASQVQARHGGAQEGRGEDRRGGPRPRGPPPPRPPATHDQVNTSVLLQLVFALIKTHIYI